jgi:hypothetical protein
MSFLKIQNGDLKILKHPTYLYPIRFLYAEFDDHDKLNFKNNSIYFSVKLTEVLFYSIFHNAERKTCQTKCKVSYLVMD